MYVAYSTYIQRRRVQGDIIITFHPHPTCTPKVKQIKIRVIEMELCQSYVNLSAKEFHGLGLRLVCWDYRNENKSDYRYATTN